MLSCERQQQGVETDIPSEYLETIAELDLLSETSAQTPQAPAFQPGPAHFLYAVQESMPRLVRYFLTIRATLNVMASSNSRRSRPVSFLIFSSRYTRVLR